MNRLYAAECQPVCTDVLGAWRRCRVSGIGTGESSCWSLGSVAVGDDETVEEATTVETTLGASTAAISDEHDAISSHAAAN